MTHVWLTNTPSTAFARCLPWRSLTSALNITRLQWAEDMATESIRGCAEEDSVPMPEPMSMG